MKTPFINAFVQDQEPINPERLPHYKAQARLERDTLLEKEKLHEAFVLELCAIVGIRRKRRDRDVLKDVGKAFQKMADQASEKKGKPCSSRRSS